MKPTDQHVQATRAEPSGEVRSARQLVRLHADETDQDLGAGPAGEAANAPLRHGAYGLVAQVGSELDRTEDPVCAHLLGESPQATQGRTRQHAAQVPEQISVGVVLRRSDEKDLEAPQPGGQSRAAADVWSAGLICPAGRRLCSPPHSRVPGLCRPPHSSLILPEESRAIRPWRSDCSSHCYGKSPLSTAEWWGGNTVRRATPQAGDWHDSVR